MASNVESTSLTDSQKLKNSKKKKKKKIKQKTEHFKTKLITELLYEIGVHYCKVHLLFLSTLCAVLY